MKLIKKGGETINDYTPLILAIRVRNVDRVEELLNRGADPNLKDERERWSPMKWNTYMYLHGPNHHNRANEILCDRIAELLVRHGANMMDYDNANFTYDFSPLVQNQENTTTTTTTTGGKGKKQTKKHRLSKNKKTLKKYRILKGFSTNVHRRKNMKGGLVPINRTVEERINDALDWNYTPLIDAIINVDTEEVERLLNVENANEVANQVDSVYGWSPMKWSHFLYYYVYNVSQRNDLRRIIELLSNAGAPFDNDNDDMSNDGGYDFSPIIPSEPPIQLDSESEDASLTDSDTSSEQDSRENDSTGGTRKRKKHKKIRTTKKKRSSKKGGSNDTQRTRVRDALRGNYTPLINAIIQVDINEVNRILANNPESKNQRDNVLGWCPRKWVDFVFIYSINEVNFGTMMQIVQALMDADPCFDNDTRREYNFAPIVNNLAQEERVTEKINNTRGGSNITEQTRINDALRGNYTPLINAIIAQNVPLVESILENGADPNESDNDIYRWCPLKWTAFVFYHNNVHDPAVYRDIKLLLSRKGSHECFDENHIHENSYNFSPARTDMDELLERRRTRRENEINNRFKKDTSGGRRKRKVSKGTKNNKGVNLRKNK